LTTPRDCSGVLGVNTLKGASFSIPEAASLLEVAGIKIVEPPTPRDQD
jgi:hypothetical protein